MQSKPHSKEQEYSIDVKQQRCTCKKYDAPFLLVTVVAACHKIHRSYVAAADQRLD